MSESDCATDPYNMLHQLRPILMMSQPIGVGALLAFKTNTRRVNIKRAPTLYDFSAEYAQRGYLFAVDR